MAALLAVLNACSAPVQLPFDSAPADVVLTTYLDALVASDCATAHALAASTFVFGNGELCGHLQVSRYSIDGQPVVVRDEEVFATTISVSGGDQSMPDGDYTWFYTLKRQPSGAWRLTGGGSGP